MGMRCSRGTTSALTPYMAASADRRALPNADRAVVPERKLLGYLLNAGHRSGRSKARFFTAHGFSTDRWPILAEALRRHASEHPVVSEEATAFGTRYVVDGILRTPHGRTPLLRVVWFIDHGDTVPRLATAYPRKVVPRDP